MMNVGIVGSSFSSGKINIAKDAKTIDSTKTTWSELYKLKSENE